MNKETYTEWYEGLKARLATDSASQEQYEMIIVDNLRSLMTNLYNTRYDLNGPSFEDRMELINHFFELIADAEMSEINARHLVCFVAGIIDAIPAARVFGKKHNTPLPSFKEELEGKPGLVRKKVAGTADKMIGRPVITEVNKAGNEVTIELPWKVALHVYRGFLVKALMSKHGYNFNDAYQCIDDYHNKYNKILAEELDLIISHKESHLVSAGGGITAAGTGLVVSGIIKPEE